MQMIGLRLKDKVKATLEEVAKQERRTVSNMARIAIEDWLIEHGHLDKSDLEDSEET
jgi:predicted transcriptional regulator